jgi:hypothetical protein
VSSANLNILVQDQGLVEYDAETGRKFLALVAEAIEQGAVVNIEVREKGRVEMVELEGGDA